MRNRLKNAIAISLGAAGAGAGLMFLFDPNRGGRRREFIGDKTVNVAKLLGRGFRKSGKGLSSRARGMATETSARVAREGSRGGAPDDEVLAARVRSKLGRVLSHPRSIDVIAKNGAVELRGGVLRTERQRAVRCAESVRGVTAVQHDALRMYSDDISIPGFQPRSGSRELMETERPGRLRGLRLGFALASGAVVVYRALKNSGTPRQQRQTNAFPEDTAADRAPLPTPACGA